MSWFGGGGPSRPRVSRPLHATRNLVFGLLLTLSLAESVGHSSEPEGFLFKGKNFFRQSYDFCEDKLTRRQARPLERTIGGGQAALERFEHFFRIQKSQLESFLNGGELASRRVHTIHLAGLKTLVEEVLYMSAAEEYLEAFYEELSSMLETHPELGAMLYADSKNFLIASPLSAVEFRLHVVSPLSARVADRLQPHYPEFNWRNWVRYRVFHAVEAEHAPEARPKGQLRMIEAYFRGAMVRAKYARDSKYVSIDDWRARATARRHELRQFFEKRGVPWDVVLEKINSLLGKSEHKERQLKKWLAEQDAEALLAELKNYYDDLQVADFRAFSEPMNTSWVIERRRFLQAFRTAGYYFATDMQGFGLVARGLQDDWIARGAHLEDLFELYRGSTEALASFVSTLKTELQSRIGADFEVVHYGVGDEGNYVTSSAQEMAQKRGLSGRAANRFARELEKSIKDVLEKLKVEGFRHGSYLLRPYSSNPRLIDHSKAEANAISDVVSIARRDLMIEKRRIKNQKP